MSFFEVAEKRYSLRKFDTKEVEKEKILKVIEAARIAPSACNLQPYHFIVITDSELRKKVAESYPREWFKNAPVIIVACGDHSKSWKRIDGKDHCDVDVAIAVDHMTLAAAEQGLGTCWVCAFDAKMCHKVLNLPKEVEVIALMPMGYPAKGSNIPEKRRKSIEEIASWNNFGTKIE